jgi:hypothetical protein
MSSKRSPGSLSMPEPVDPKDFGPSKPVDLDDMFGPPPDQVDHGEVVYPSVYRRPKDEVKEDTE